MFHLEVLLTADTDKERLEWEDKLIDEFLRLVDGVSVYDGYGAFRMKDGTIMKEHHSRIVVYGADAHEIHQLYSMVYPMLIEYLRNAGQESVLVIMNGSTSLIHLEEPTSVLP